MNDFLSSVKGDLLDRRMLPILALLGVALAAALAYALLAGGSSSAPTPATLAPAPAATPPAGIVVSQAQTTTGQPVAETTSGTAHRSARATRNPFAPLPGAKTTRAATTATPSATTAAEPSKSGESTSASSESSSGSTGGTTPAPEANKPAAKEKSQTVYHVAVRFGTAAPGTPPLSAQLTPYDELKRQQPLPDDKQPLIVFRGVIAGGKSASFTLVGEAILRGSAACLPSASQCQAIDLKPGQTEELEYIPLGAAAVTYQLQVVSITSSKASASAARRSFKGESKSGLELLRHAGLEALPGLRYSSANGVLVFVSRPAFAARAHVAAWGAHL